MRACKVNSDFYLARAPRRTSQQWWEMVSVDVEDGPRRCGLSMLLLRLPLSASFQFRECSNRQLETSFVRRLGKRRRYILSLQICFCSLLLWENSRLCSRLLFLRLCSWGTSYRCTWTQPSSVFSSSLEGSSSSLQTYLTTFRKVDFDSPKNLSFNG